MSAVQTFDNIQVLLIQGSHADAVLIKANLRCSEHPIYTVHHVKTLDAAIAALADKRYDLIVLDLTLADSQGMETLDSVSKIAIGTPIVVITELADDSDVLEALRHGAQDCFEKSEAITKPLGHVLQYSVENYHHKHVRQDVASAEFVQQRLFPNPLPPIRGYDVAGRCDPANQVSGDYFDYFIGNDDHLFVVIGDVTGHGFGPSLVMAETRAALRTMAAISSDIEKIIKQINQLIHDHDFHWFVTLFIGKIDTTTGRCQYASAGQPVILRRGDGTMQQLAALDHPLGIDSEIEFGVFDVQLGDQDTLLLYTDGVSERSPRPDHFFGTERLEAVLETANQLSAAETVSLIFDAANDFAEDRNSVDDMTVVVVKVGDTGS